MWTTRRAKQAIVSPRPVRVAYIVPNPPPHELLDALFDEAMSRWGGRRTPIVQSDGANFGADDWKLLGLWDADIIYSYVNLDGALHRRLAHRLAPSKFIIHPGEDGDRLLPSLAEDSSLLSSVSVVPLLGKWRSFRGQAIPEVLDKERHVGAPRDLADSFGFASSSLNDFALLPYARRASLRPPHNDRYAQRFRSPDEITYIDSVAEVETRIAEQAGLLCLAQLSDMFAPYLAALHERRSSWEDHLSIIVGDEVADRLLFWNGIHRYQSLMEPGHTQLLRLSANRFAEGLLAWVSRLTSGLRNRRHFNGNAAPRTIVKSCSVDEEALNRIAAAIRAPGMLMSSAEKLGQESVFASLRDYQPPNERGGRAAIFISGWHSPSPKADSRVRFERDQFELPLTVPSHLRDIAIGPTTGGTWAVDLRIDRNEDHSPYDNQRHRWMFPRRLRLELAVRLENYGPDRMALTPSPRPTEEGDLSVRDGLQWKRPIITLPSDLGGFTQAVSSHHPETPRQNRPREGLSLAHRFMPVEVSDKGRDLLGVFQLFRSLPEALIFLTNPFWLSVIERLCPTEPDANQERVDELGRELRQALERHAEAIDFGRLARRVMNRTAGWMEADNKRDAFVRYDDLLAAMPNELSRNEWRNTLEQSVQYLRDRSFLRQGYAWKCGVCQYPNWVHLEDMVPILRCEICRVEKSSPVSGNANVHFRLNPFVGTAFSSSSAQATVAWVLDRLANKASWSFMFSPALDVYKVGEPNRYTDLDVLAAVDGETFLLEVKRGFAGINAREVEKLIEVATTLRPDVAGFAVQRPRGECSLTAAELEDIKRRLTAVDVEFVLWTSDDQDPWRRPNDIPIAYGRTMDWSAW
jgi:hypothetical protein